MRCLFWMRFRSGASPRLRPINLIACALLTIPLGCLLGCWLPSSPAPVSRIPLLFKVLLGPPAEDCNLSAPLGWNRWEAGGKPHIPFYSSGILKRLFLNTDLHSPGMARSTAAPRNLWTIPAHLTAGGDRLIPILPGASGLTGTY